MADGIADGLGLRAARSPLTDDAGSAAFASRDGSSQFLIQASIRLPRCAGTVACCGWIHQAPRALGVGWSESREGKHDAQSSLSACTTLEVPIVPHSVPHSSEREAPAQHSFERSGGL